MRAEQELKDKLVWAHQEHDKKEKEYKSLDQISMQGQIGENLYQELYILIGFIATLEWALKNK